jgi:hypothetical protein
MRLGSVGLGIVLAIGTFAILLQLELIPYLTGGAAGGPPPVPADAGGGRPLTFGQQFAALPPWVVVWMHFQDIIVAASLFFVLWRKEAQIYAAAIIANHVFLFAVMPFVPPEKITLGIAALSHWFWIIPLVVLIRQWPHLDKKTGFGTWATVAIGQPTFSLMFDIPDGVQFFASLVA